MTKDEALKMAYDWLNEYAPPEVVQACKEALALSEKQHTFPDKKQPAQEPVAWMNDIAFSMDKELLGTRSRIVPLYTHPAPSWQGLSDDEICLLNGKLSNVAGEFAGLSDWILFANAIEQALKEKNNAV